MIVRTAKVGMTARVAWYSDCEAYRYLLRISWGAAPGWLLIACNPSTATELANDPTIERMQRRAERAGCGSLTICNAHALRSTDPKGLLTAADPTGPHNDLVIRGQVDEATLVICAWGNHRAVRERGHDVMRLIRAQGATPHALKLNRDGSPAHPLYLPYTAQPFPIS